MHRWFHWFIREDRRREILVVIWGVHTPDWMDALAPSAPVWKQLPEIREVVVLPDSARDVPWRARWGRRTVVIPLMEVHIERRPARYAALVPTSEAVATLADKGRFVDYVENHRLAHLCPTPYSSIEAAAFPCVIKRTNLNGGCGVELAATPEQARHLLEREPFAGHPCIIQSLAPVLVEYVVHCVCLDGRIIWHRVYACDREKEQIRRGGDGVALRLVTIPDSVLEKLESFLLPLAYSGPCNVDCTWDDDGRLVVFEINPRLGGSLMRPENAVDLAACLSVIIAHAVRDDRVGRAVGIEPEAWHIVPSRADCGQR